MKIEFEPNDQRGNAKVLFEFRIGIIQNRRAITIKKDILKKELL
jgi:hypothetical protein